MSADGDLGWLGGVMVTASDLRSTGRGFDSQPFHYQVAPWASCSHTCSSVTKQYNLVPAKGRWCSAALKITVGRASHWPCVKDFSGLWSTYGLKGYEREMSTPPTLRRGKGDFTHFTLDRDLAELKKAWVQTIRYSRQWWCFVAGKQFRGVDRCTQLAPHIYLDHLVIDQTPCLYDTGNPADTLPLSECMIQCRQTRPLVATHRWNHMSPYIQPILYQPSIRALSQQSK